MTWQEIYNKYKDTELMKEFEEWCKIFIEIATIKDIWGYLVCFAETKGVIMDIKTNYVRYIR